MTDTELHTFLSGAIPCG